MPSHLPSYRVQTTDPANFLDSVQLFMVRLTF